MQHKVHMSVDDYTFNVIKEMQEAGKYSSMVDAIRDAIELKRNLQLQAQEGFDIIALQNRKTKMERTLIGRIR